jgi:hypothetical protein
VIPVVSYDQWTADEEFQAAGDSLLQASSADNVLEQPLEISPGMLHLTQPYLPKDVRHQPLLLATQGGSRVAAGHRWARLSACQVRNFCQDEPEWLKWIHAARDYGRRLLPTRWRYLNTEQLGARADAMCRHDKALKAGLVSPARLTLRITSHPNPIEHDQGPELR